MGRGSLTHGNVLIFSWDHTLEPGERVRKGAKVSWPCSALFLQTDSISCRLCVCWLHLLTFAWTQQRAWMWDQISDKCLFPINKITYCLWGVQPMKLSFLWIWVSWLDSLMSSKIWVPIEAFPTAGILQSLLSVLIHWCPIKYKFILQNFLFVGHH